MAGTKSKSSTATIQIDSGSHTGKLLGLKWYWWLLIIVGIICIVSGGSIAGGASGLGSKIARAILGFSSGVLNALARSPFAYFMALIFLAPFIGRGACAAYRAYRDQYGSGKTQQDTQKELGIDKDSLDAVVKDAKTKNPNDKNAQNDYVNQWITDKKTSINQEFVTKTQENLQNKVNNGQLTVQEAQQQMDAINEQAQENAEKDETTPPEPGKIEEAPKP